MKKRDVVARWCVTLAMLWTCCAVIPRSALAIPPDGPWSNWDFTDPVNIAETRTYAALWFDYKDTGVISQELAEFRFTNTPPHRLRIVFSRSQRLMEELYAHRLNPNSESPDYYTIHDLRRDDPEVEAAFRLHATTGVFATPLDGDLELLTNHLASVANALGPANQFSLSPDGGLNVTDGSLESTGLSLLETPDDPGSVDPPDGPIGIHPVIEDIKDNLPWMPTPDVPAPYWPDHMAPCPPGSGKVWCDAPGQPGYDCDDWARAYAAWLKKHLTQYPNAKYFLWVMTS